jgi:uncharacterized phiE125 gp8 family phage protein
MATDLVTLAEYKAYAGIASDTLDSVVTAIIPKVSQLVKSLCRRTFVDYINDSKIEVFSGNNESKIFLKEYPILQIQDVELSTDYGNTYTSLVEYTDYVLDQEDGSIVALGYTDAVFPKYINGYKVTYTAGYETLPEDLKVAVLDLVTYYVKNDGSVHSPKAPGTNTVQIEYITTTNLPAHIKRVLDLYTASFD